MGICEVRRVGVDAALVEVADAAEALALATWARDLPIDAEEVVPGACTVLFDGLVDELTDPERLRDKLAAWTPAPPAAVTGREVVRIPVTYDGADLSEVAAAWGLDVDAAVARHAGIEFASAFCGFAPGFAYLSGLPQEWAVPRLDSPRSRVPAGAVALAGAWCGVYPTASPGGWRILGTTDVVLWDQDRADPALLAPGTRVRFDPA